MGVEGGRRYVSERGDQLDSSEVVYVNLMMMQQDQLDYRDYEVGDVVQGYQGPGKTSFDLNEHRNDMVGL